MLKHLRRLRSWFENLLSHFLQVRDFTLSKIARQKSSCGWESSTGESGYVNSSAATYLFSSSSFSYSEPYLTGTSTKSEAKLAFSFRRYLLKSLPLVILPQGSVFEANSVFFVFHVCCCDYWGGIVGPVRLFKPCWDIQMRSRRMYRNTLVQWGANKGDVYFETKDAKGKSAGTLQ